MAVTFEQWFYLAIAWTVFAITAGFVVGWFTGKQQGRWEARCAKPTHPEDPNGANQR